MSRRVNRGNPDWQPLLIIAAVGALSIAIGIGCLIIQLAVSIRHRQQTADLTGDPWGGRNLEWATASPPPVYNFAVIPEVDGIDAFMAMKKRQIAYAQSAPYQAIYLPKNTGIGIIFGGLSFAFVFAMIWHIGWLAIATALAMLISIIVRSFDDDHEYRLSAEEIEAIERDRFERLAEAAAESSADHETQHADRPSLPGVNL